MYLEKIIREKNMSKLQFAMRAGIAPSDFYQAVNGKIPFFKGWRKRIAEVLEIAEDELFPEYVTGKEE
jgi:predicted transcriptional regulator